MYEWETKMLLKHYLDQGVSKAELSRRFGVNRRTIHNWVKTGQLDRDLTAGARAYSPRPPVPHKLDPYKGMIETRLEEFPGAVGEAAVRPRSARRATRAATRVCGTTCGLRGLRSRLNRWCGSRRRRATRAK